MNKEKVIKFLKSNIGLSVVTGIVCFSIGGAIFSDNKTVAILKKEKATIETELSQKNVKIQELQAKVDEAKPWFDMKEEERLKAEEEKRKEEEAKKAEEARLAEEKKKKEAEEKAQREAEEKAKLEAQGVNTETVKAKVNRVFGNEIKAEFTNTTLNKVDVNENLGTDSNKDVVVLGYLTWTTMNKENMTREMLKMYSDHLAAKLAPELADGSEIALFWHAEYTGLDIKHSYTIMNGKAYIQ